MDYADPPGMPDDERMTDAELRVVREHLGLTGDALAAHLGVSGRTVRHWEHGKYEVPDGSGSPLKTWNSAPPNSSTAS